MDHHTGEEHKKEKYEEEKENENKSTIKQWEQNVHALVALYRQNQMSGLAHPPLFFPITVVNIRLKKPADRRLTTITTTTRSRCTPGMTNPIQKSPEAQSIHEHE